MHTECADADDFIAQLNTMRRMQKLEKDVCGEIFNTGVALETFYD